MRKAFKAVFGVLLLIYSSFFSAGAQGTFPTINISVASSEPKCFNSSFTLIGKVDPFVPVKNPAFDIFIQGIANYLRTKYSASTNLYLDIINTNYSSIAEHLSLWDDLSTNKSTIVYFLLFEIKNQHSDLTYDELNILNRYFNEAANAQSSWPQPYYSYIYDWEYGISIAGAVNPWRTLTTEKGEDQSVEFKPDARLVVLSDKTTIAFRARARNTITGQSKPEWSYTYTDILPAPPTFDPVSFSNSCLNKPTGEISISNIKSIDPLNFYYYNIIKSGDPSGPYDTFSGTQTTIKGYFSGSYTLYLSYGDVKNRGCYSKQTFTIGSFPELQFNVLPTDVSCNGGSDGSIRVDITQGVAGSYKISTNNYTSYTSGYTFTNLKKNTYTINVSDFCYDKSALKNIGEPPQVIINSVTSTRPTCNSMPNGGFSINVSGGSGNKYDYRIINSSGVTIVNETAQGSTWTNYSLPGGTYTINVRDNALPNCAGVSQIKVLDQVDPIRFSNVDVKKVNCFGESSGEIKVTGAGGSGLYSFSLNSESYTGNPSTFSSLSTGSYTIFIRNSDANCTDLASTLVIVPGNPKIEISLTPKDVTCFEKDDGQISTAIAGGTNSYSSYDWEIKNNLNWVYYPTFAASPTNLEPGEYRVKVTDSEHCSTLATSTISQPAKLIISSVVPHDIICYGGTGSIDIAASGGMGEFSFSYSLNGGSYTGFTSGSPFVEGAYFLKVRDSKGCETIWEENGDETEVNITSPPAVLNISANLSDFNGFNISCYGKSDGTININATGGNGDKGSGGTYSGYTYSLSGVAYQNNAVFNNLVAGNYSISVKDGRGCTASKLITLTQPAAMNIPIPSVEPVKCFGSATGKITVTPTGGVQPYTFQLNNTGFVSSGLFSGLYSGTYQIDVKDRNSCPQTIGATVENKNQQIKTILTPQDVRCFGENNGQISATITGGSGGFADLWEKLVNGKWQTAATGLANIDHLNPGKYRLSVTDTDNCSAYDSAIISQPSLLSIPNVISHDIVCFGNNGSIDISATGGHGGYKYFYSVNGGASFTEFTSGSPFPAADYKLKATDSKGCEVAWNNLVKISSPSGALNFTATLSDHNGFNISCFGNSNGSITLNATGGNGAGYSGYSYSFNGGTFSSQSVYSNLTAGSYSIRLTDGRGCSITKPVSLTQPSAPVGLEFSKLVNTKCFNDSSGIITLASSGGAQPYEYQMNQKYFTVNNEFTKLPTGNYQFTVRDKNGCTNTISTVISNIYPEPAILLVPQDIICFHKNDGSIYSSITGGSGSFGLKWSMKTDNSWQFYKSDSSIISCLAPGDYRIQATDLAGCPAIYDSTTIYQNITPLIIDHVSMRDIICYGETGSIDIQASGSNGGYIYQYSKNDQPYVDFSPNMPLFFGEYKLRVKDSKGCETLWPENAIITQPPKALNFTWAVKDFNGSNVSCFGKSDGQLILKPNGGNGHGYYGYTYILPGRPEQSDTLFNNLAAGSYNISVTDGRGCKRYQVASLIQPSAAVSLVISNQIDSKCFNDSTGIVTLEASGGVKSFEYSIDQENYVNENEFSKLCHGNYHFTVSDKNGCTNTVDAVLNNIYPKPSLSLVPQEISCYRENDGLIDASLTGGSGSFGLKWYMKTNNSWQYLKADSSRITQLAPGDYRIQATDLAGCPSIYDSTTVYQNVTPLVIDHVSMRDIICYGENGSIDIQASGSNGGYTYQYSKNNQVFTNYSPGSPLPSSSYKLRVTDAKGCKTIWPELQIITEPAEPLSLTWIAKDYAGYNVSCFGNNDGRFALKSSGGNGAGYQGYSFLMSGRPLQTDSLFDNMKAGVYNIKMTDGRGCTLSRDVILTQPESKLGLWASEIKQATCFDGEDGMVSLVGSGGSLPYTYSSGNDLFVSDSVFRNLKVDKYLFTVKDANGCTQIFDTSIFNKVPKMEITGTISDAKCVGQNSGSIRVNISGGAQPFIYQWKEISLTNFYIEKLLKGNYTLNITDSAGCKAEQIFEIKEPLHPLVINKVKLHDIVCLGDSGSIDIEASGSNGGYIYQYSKNSQAYRDYLPGAPLPFAEYKLKVEDAGGCEAVWPDDLTITRPSEALGFTSIAKDFNGSNVSCFGNEDGSLIVKPFGGNGAGYSGYYYYIPGRPVQTDILFDRLSAGAYNISITDARGCTKTQPVFLKQPSDPVSLQIIKLKDTKCFNDSTGTITLAASGGVQTYKFMIGEDGFVSSNVFGNLPVGNYHFTVQDKNGCTKTLNTAVSHIYPKPIITLLPQDIRCYQKQDGLIKVSLTGGSGSFNLKWYAKTINSWQYIKSDSSIISHLAPGDYRIMVTDLADCPSIYDSTTIFQKVTPLHVTAISQDACDKSQNGAILPSGSGGTAPYRFAIDSQSPMQNISSFPVYGGQHKVFVSDATNCLADTAVVVNIKNTMPGINFMVASSRYELDTLVIKDVSIPKPDYVSWEFSPEALVIETSPFEAKVKYEAKGIYPVRMTGYFGTCDYTLEKFLSIAPYDPQVIPKDKYLNGIESIQISPNPNKGQFKIRVKLYTKQQIQIKILDYYAKTWYNRRYPVTTDFEQDINIPDALPGTYILLVISDNDSKASLFIISQ